MKIFAPKFKLITASSAAVAAAAMVLYATTFTPAPAPAEAEQFGPYLSELTQPMINGKEMYGPVLPTALHS
ncbi:MAG: hypothetical protein AAGA78_11265 [Pseudomonadota bacterium]